MLYKGDIRQDEQNIVIGLRRLKVLKLNGLSKITDHPLSKIVETSEYLEHLEVARCEALTGNAMKILIQKCPKLKLVDMNGVKELTYTILDEIRTMCPELMVKRYRDQVADPKDTGLRVPLPVKNDKKKKKKKKGKKKK